MLNALYVDGNFKVQSYRCECPEFYTGNHCEVKCGGGLSQITGLITSPGYPDSYSNGLGCHWYFSGLYSKVVLKFFALNLQNEDGIIISGKNGTTVQTVTFRSQQSQKILVESDFVAISFFSGTSNSMNTETNKYVIWYETFNSENLTETNNSVIGEEWIFEQMSLDRTSKNEEFREKLDKLSKITSIDLAEEFERELVEIDGFNNNSFSWSGKQIAKPKQYEVRILVEKAEQSHYRYYRLSPLRLLETVQLYLEGWIREEMLQSRLLGRVLVKKGWKYVWNI